jgi:hypothetical protein
MDQFRAHLVLSPSSHADMRHVPHGECQNRKHNKD